MSKIIIFTTTEKKKCNKLDVPADIVVVSEPSVGLELLIGVGVVNGVLGKLSNGASGWFMS